MESSEISSALSALRPLDVPIDDVISFRGTLGRGSFGTVKLGKLKSSKKKVAVKVLKKKNIHSRRQLNQLCREIQTIGALRHENIIAFYGLVDNRENVYLLLEYASGGELFDHVVKNGHLSEPEAAVCFRDMVKAVVHVHSKNIVHRDIKPENFLVTKSGKVKLSDFGFCNTQVDGRFVVTPCGSPTYAAPEIYKNTPYDLSVDTWSLGVCLYVMVTGCSPWGASNGNMLDDSVRKRLLKGEFIPLPSSVPKDCANLIGSMIQARPENRLDLELVLMHPWMLRVLGRDGDDDAAATAGGTSSSMPSAKNSNSDNASGVAVASTEASAREVGGKSKSRQQSRTFERQQQQRRQREQQQQQQQQQQQHQQQQQYQSPSRNSNDNSRCPSMTPTPPSTSRPGSSRSRPGSTLSSSSSVSRSNNYNGGNGNNLNVSDRDRWAETDSANSPRFARNLSMKLKELSGEPGAAGIKTSGTVEHVVDNSMSVSSVLTAGREESVIRNARRYNNYNNNNNRGSNGSTYSVLTPREFSRSSINPEQLADELCAPVITANASKPRMKLPTKLAPLSE